MSLFELDNVRISKDIQEMAKSRGATVFSFAPEVEDVLKALVTAKPLWTFEAAGWSNTYDIGETKGMRLTEVRVYQDGEELGKFYRTRARGGEQGIFVTNKRIREKRERGGGLSTKDTKKAVAEIKKNFGATTVAERIEAALSNAIDKLYRAATTKHQHSLQADRVMRDHLTKFVDSEEGQRLFWEYVDNKALQTDAKAIHQAQEAEVKLAREAVELDNMRIAFVNSKSMLVLRTNGEYITRLNGEIKTETDSTLPEDIRMKLGMLKLVQDEEAVSTVGFRVDDSTFIVSMGDRDD